jgi:hypothetical protein
MNDSEVVKGTLLAVSRGQSGLRESTQSRYAVLGEIQCGSAMCSMDGSRIDLIDRGERVISSRMRGSTNNMQLARKGAAHSQDSRQGSATR